MTSKDFSRPYGSVFQWKIENLSQCYWLGKGIDLDSPTFVINGIYSTKWSLCLHTTTTQTFENFIALTVNREEDDGPLEIEAICEFAFLGKNGAVLKSACENISVKMGEGGGPSISQSQRKVFVTQRRTFLPEDTLTIQCTLQEIYDGGADPGVCIITKPVEYEYIYARTVFSLIQRPVLWKIDKFSTAKPGLRNKFKDNFIDLDLILNRNAFQMYVNSCDKSLKYISVNVSILDIRGRKVNCGVGEFDGMKVQWSGYRTEVSYGKFNSRLFCISDIPYKLMRQKNQYMPFDVLSLHIEYAFLTVTDVYESFDFETIPPELTMEIAEIGHARHGENMKSQNPSALLNDLKSMYTDEIFSDTKLHTSSQTFPVHKSILSARSPVFCRMFTSDMNEKNCGTVHITDLENDTVHRMLLFIYTDSLQNLQFESASKLYEAADKYEIFSLKSRCSIFLKDNMCPTNVCDVLILADMHQDEDLIRFAQTYILEHEEVFALKEWSHFMEKNLKLASEIMLKKIHPRVK